MACSGTALLYVKKHINKIICTTRVGKNICTDKGLEVRLFCRTFRLPHSTNVMQAELYSNKILLEAEAVGIYS
jgi:hypothetical protein